MIYRKLLLVLLLSFFVGCVEKNKINIGDIALVKGTSLETIAQDRYMSFTQEYYDNTKYTVNEYCDDKRALLMDDKFSTEIYIKITNDRTKQNRVGKYPIWFLINDDAKDIQCVKKSANFINEEPFVVSNSDKLTLKLLQKNQEEKRVPVKELSILIDVVGLVVPQTATFLMRSNNIINDPTTKRYLDTMENAFTNGDLDGTKSRDFNTQINSIKIKLFVPQDDGKQRELGYILLKPKYRATLSTVDTVKGVPNYKYIYTSSDPRIQDIMNYKIKSKGLIVKQEVDNFSHVADEYIIDALSSLNVHLLNRFTSYDRGLVLALALRQSDLYKKFSQAIRTKNIQNIKYCLNILNDKNNPLHDLSKILNLTGIEYYRLMYQVNKLVKNIEITRAEEIKEQNRIKQEETKRQIELQGIENFLRPVARWSYISKMFTKDANIIDSQNRGYSIGDLQTNYNRQDNVISYGCYTNLQNSIHGVTIQDYLIHPNYTDGIKYNYMALSMDKNKTISVFFYKLSSEDNLKISNILIDKDGYFIMKSRLKEVLKTKSAKMCYQNILSAL
ncbi:MAG TPA: hypothetical protein ENK88_00140 [Campylobacterales bacterium]|nr:hypothetical protein [Campylobacterales bacterium]HHH50988.1 hypothetical protein [Campylobacterales bacterium]